MTDNFDVDKYNYWSELRIKAVIHPDELTEQERERITKFVSKTRKHKTPLSTEQLEVLRRYEKKRRIEDNFDKKTLANRLSQIANFCYFIKKPFNEVTKEDIIKYLEYLDVVKKVKAVTIDNYKSAIKTFFQWFYGLKDKQYPEIVEWMKRKRGKGLKLPEEILTEEEILRMAEKVDNPRDRALILVTYESGCRIGEIINLRLKHLRFDEYGAILMVNGKTGQRRVRLINCVPTLKIYLNNHLFKGNMEAPLWVCLNKNCYGSPLHRDGFVGVLKKAGNLAGINKRVNPHSFRHARATQLAKILTEQELKIFFGWTRGSNMASIYVHLSGEDVDRKLLEKAGKFSKEEIKEDKLKPKKCTRCGEENSSDAKFCSKCYYPLEIDAVNQIETLKSIINEFITTKLLQKPGFIEELPKLVEEWGKSKK